MLLFSARHGLFTQDDSNNTTTSVSAGGPGSFAAMVIIYMTFLWWICFCYEELYFLRLETEKYHDRRGIVHSNRHIICGNQVFVFNR